MERGIVKPGGQKDLTERILNFLHYPENGDDDLARMKWLAKAWPIALATGSVLAAIGIMASKVVK